MPASGGGDRLILPEDEADTYPGPMPDQGRIVTLTTVSTEDSTETRPRRGDRGLFGLVLLFAGIVWFLSRAGMLHVAADTLLSILLICIGAGLLLTRRSGRRFWPILLGGVVLFTLMGSSASARIQWHGSSGQTVFTPTSPSDLQRPYQLDAGQMRLDLTNMVFANTVQVQAKVGAGQLAVVVPSNVPITVRYEEGVGGINVEGRELGNALFSKGSWSSPQRQSSSRRILLDLEVGAGHIDVITGGSAPVPASPKLPPTPTLPPAPKVPSPGTSK